MEIILFIFYFIFASFLAFFIPGRVVIGEQKKLSRAAIITLSYILGIALWGWQGFVLGFLHLRTFSYLYILVFSLLYIKKYFSFHLEKIEIKKPDRIAILIAVVGVLGQTVQFIKGGLATKEGLFIVANNNVDHIWNISLVSELIKRFPPFEPSLYGIPLLNYHFWFQLVTADLIRVFNLPMFQTEFIGIPIMLSALLAFIVYLFSKEIYNSQLFTRLLLFFVFFTGDIAGYFMLLIRHKFDWSVGWLFEDGSIFVDSPGKAIAILLGLSGLFLIFKYKEKIVFKNWIIVALLFGSLFGFKIYIGIPFILGLGFYALILLLKRNYAYLSIFILASILSLIQFLPFNKSSGGLFFLLLDIPREFMSQEIFHMGYINQRWGMYLVHNNYFRLAEYGLYMVAVFLIVQYGVKLFAFIPLKRTVQKLGKEFYLFLYSILLSSFILGLFFFQKVGGSNVWEFFLAASPMLSIFASLNLALYFPKKTTISALLIIFLLVFGPIRWIISEYNYVKGDYFSGFHGLTNSQLASYNFIKNNTSVSSNILFLNESYVFYTSLANVVSQRNSYYSGPGVSQIMTPELKKRMDDSEVIRTSTDSAKIDSILKKDKIDYVATFSPLPISTLSSSLKEVFVSGISKVYKVE